MAGKKSCMMQRSISPCRGTQAWDFCIFFANSRDKNSTFMALRPKKYCNFKLLQIHESPTLCAFEVRTSHSSVVVTIQSRSLFGHWKMFVDSARARPGMEKSAAASKTVIFFMVNPSFLG